MSNPQAFPLRWSVTTATGTMLEDHEPGMTLRDYFAGQALAGIMSNPATADEEWSADKIATTAYAVARAMLKAQEATL